MSLQGRREKEGLTTLAGKEDTKEAAACRSGLFTFCKLGSDLLFDHGVWLSRYKPFFINTRK